MRWLQVLLSMALGVPSPPKEVPTRLSDPTPEILLQRHWTALDRNPAVPDTFGVGLQGPRIPTTCQKWLPLLSPTHTAPHGCVTSQLPPFQLGFQRLPSGKLLCTNDKQGETGKPGLHLGTGSADTSPPGFLLCMAWVSGGDGLTDIGEMNFGLPNTIHPWYPWGTDSRNPTPGTQKSKDMPSPVYNNGPTHVTQPKTVWGHMTRKKHLFNTHAIFLPIFSLWVSFFLRQDFI